MPLCVRLVEAFGLVKDSSLNSQPSLDETQPDRLNGVMAWRPTSEPGWYQDPNEDGTQTAYWNGENWTGDTRPTDSELPTKSRKVAWVIGGIFFGVVLLFGFFSLLALALMFYE